MSNKSGISRRQFLNTAGTVVGLSALAAYKPIVDSVLGGKTLKIGVLLPSSNIYPGLGDKFLAGIRLYLDQDPVYHNIQLISEPSGYGPGSALAAAKKMLDREHCDIITGITGTEVSTGLRDLVSERQKFLIANHLGANLIRQTDSNPYIIHNTMNYWQSNWALGRWAGENLGKRVFVSASFYESGYDAHYAFQAGFESSGGEIVGEYTDNLPREMNHKNRHFHEITRSKPDLVFASYSGSQSARYIRNYQRAGFAGKIPLLTSGFAVEQSILDQVGKAADGIYSCRVWTGDNSGSGFVNAFRKYYKQEPDDFAVLGFETGLLISSAIAKGNFDLKDAHSVQQKFTQTLISSPRGERFVDSSTKQTSPDHYLQRVRFSGTRYCNQPVQKLAAHPEIENIATRIASNPKTGWLNPYLCA